MHGRYSEALQLEPSNARAYYSFGNLYLDSGDHARALPLCACPLHRLNMVHAFAHAVVVWTQVPNRRVS